MITPELIERINELAHKKKLIGLTEAEIAEQSMLRRTYLDNIKRQLTATLERIEIVDEPADKEAKSGEVH